MNTALRLLRADLRDYAPYVAGDVARGVVRLHANEAPWSVAADASLKTYPAPVPDAVSDILARFYGIERQSMLLTRGSNEGIDLLLRAFCAAGRDAILTCPPTFSMYATAAKIQGAEVREVPLSARHGFKANSVDIVAACDADTKLVFICSPNNPTGNSTPGSTLGELCSALQDQALVVVDEAYAEFAPDGSAVELLRDFDNLVVLRTLSKAFGMAGARCGVVLGSQALIGILAGLMPPYALSSLTVDAVAAALTESSLAALRANVRDLVDRRNMLATRLGALSMVRRVWPSDANFLLVCFADPQRVLASCRDAGLLLRDFSTRASLQGCLRITIGSREDTERLLAILEAQDRE